jgi:hypothetical protein
MSNCSNSANSQLKAMQARLDRVDDDLIAHYAGISQLVAGLAANPLTSGSVAPSLKTFNFSSVGHTLLKKLVGLVPGYDQFKSLQHLDSAALVNNMASKAANEATAMVNTMASQVTAAATAQANAIAAQATAAANLARGIAEGVSDADRYALEAAVGAANGAVDIATQSLAGVNQLASQLGGFIKCLSDVSSCKTHSSVIQ